MAPSGRIVEILRRHRLVPVIAIEDADSAVPLSDALVLGGLPVVEISLRTEAAPAAMSKIAAARGAEVALIAGTVTSPEQVKQAVDCGAQAIVSPGLNPRVVEHCLKHEIAVLPGVCTPTEIETARNYGLMYLKFFPAEASGGVKMLRALADVYEKFGFMPTGGISSQNVAEYLQLPIVMACGGSWLTPRELVAQRRFEEIAARVTQAVATVAAVRSTRG